MENLIKVAQITLLFWLMKIVATTLGETFGATFGDFLTNPLNKGGLEPGTLFASIVAIGMMVLLITISEIQQRKRRGFIY